MPEYPPGVRDPAHRIEMPCDSCGQIDNHPQHQIITDMAAGRVINRHFDCCHYAGCPDEVASCTTWLRESGAAKGEALTAFIHSPRGREVHAAIHAQRQRRLDARLRGGG